MAALRHRAVSRRRTRAGAAQRLPCGCGDQARAGRLVVLRARFAREAHAGELREGGAFALVGRFAKTGVGCPGGDVLFRDGFE